MAITSSTDIANLALDLISSGTVQDIENPSNATEEILNRWYDQCRRKLLREHPWNFATKRIVLAADVNSPPFGYAAQFSVPSDFIRILSLGTSLTIDRETLLPTDGYQFEGNKIMLNGYYEDASAVRLIYICDFKTVSQMDPMFIDLLAYDLALAIAYKITETNTNIERLNGIKERRAAMAKSIDGQERPPVRMERSRALIARSRAGRSRNNHRITF